MILVNRLNRIIPDSCAEILRCAQNDTGEAVILSAAKNLRDDLLRTPDPRASGESRIEQQEERRWVGARSAALHPSSLFIHEDVFHTSRSYAGRVGSLYVPWSGLPRG